jgi:hypothetical protein
MFISNKSFTSIFILPSYFSIIGSSITTYELLLKLLEKSLFNLDISTFQLFLSLTLEYKFNV